MDNEARRDYERTELDTMRMERPASPFTEHLLRLAHDIGKVQVAQMQHAESDEIAKKWNIKDLPDVDIK